MIIQPQIITKSEEWTRPNDWLPIDHLVTNGEEKMVGLYAVWDASGTAKGFNNYCAITMNRSYTVDWGDGNVENFNSGVQAEHEYVYSGISDNTICSRGYKQVIITITPQDGQHITYINLGNKHSAITNHYYTSSNWLDVKLSSIDLQRIYFWNVSKAQLLEKFVWYQITNACTNTTNMFYQCNSLQSVNLSNFNTSNVTIMQNMFGYCLSLQTLDISNFNTANVTSMQNMFGYCSSLRSLDLSNFNTANVISMYSMFAYCMSLQVLDLSSFDTSKVTNMSTMFYNCSSLQTILFSNNFNTIIVTTMYSMFYGCGFLQTVSLSNFNTSAVTNITYMFYQCTTLQSVDLSHTTLSAVTDNTLLVSGMNSMTICRLPQIGKTFTVANSKLDASALNALFTDLRDLSSTTSQTLTITGTPGAATCDQTIATNKNWVIIN